MTNEMRQPITFLQAAMGWLVAHRRGRGTRRHALLLSAALTTLGLALGACATGDNRAAGGATAQPVTTAREHGLLLVRGGQLLIRDMASGKEEVLAETRVGEVYYSAPRWAPDGRRIAYVRTVQQSGNPGQDWGSEVVLVGTDGQGEQVAFRRPRPGVSVDGLAWAPDGGSLYLGVNEVTIKDGRFLGQTLTVERFDLASGTRTVVARDASLPTLSPDGGRVAYVSYGLAGGQSGLWLARSDGAEARLLVPMDDTVAAILAPRFSPDGSRIAYAAVVFRSGAEPSPGRQRAARRRPWQARPAAAHGLPMDIWVVAVAGGAPRRLTNLVEDEPNPAWSPDGAELAILATGGLYRMPGAGGDARKVGLGAFGGQLDWR